MQQNHSNEKSCKIEATQHVTMKMSSALCNRYRLSTALLPTKYWPWPQLQPPLVQAAPSFAQTITQTSIATYLHNRVYEFSAHISTEPDPLSFPTHVLPVDVLVSW